MIDASPNIPGINYTHPNRLMNNLFKRLFHPLALIIVLSVILNIALWLAVTFFVPDTDSTVLHYSIGVGIDLIGSGGQIYLLPLIGLLILIGNTLLGFFLKPTDIRSSWLLWSVVLPVHLILLCSFILIILAN
jgi:hypothetical protein